MRSRRDVRGWTAAALFVLATGAGPASAQPAPPSPRPIAPAEIARALDVVRSDPNLRPERKIRMLAWKPSASSAPASGRPSWVDWITGLFEWIAQSLRGLMWVVGLIAAGVIAASLVRLLRARRSPAPTTGLTAPTHVRDLDIRPESLPGDIGAAARALWDRGEQRAALALLYRGALSRLVHVHHVPIRDSSTEGDCVRLASTALAPPPRDYLSRLVHVWQTYVYGGQDATHATVHGLCDQFASALDAPANGLPDPGGAA